MRTKGILGLLISIALVFSLSFAQPVNAASAEEEVLQVSTNFAKAFNTSNPELMSSLWWHSPKASLFGPDKREAFLIQGWEQIENSFKSVFGLPAGTYNASSYNEQITMLGDNAAIITNYVITVINPPAVKDQTTVQERATMVFHKIDGKWLIVHLQVSVLPTE